MKKIRCAEGIMISARSLRQKERAHYRNPVLTLVSYKYHGRRVTSRNFLIVRWDAVTGNTQKIWYIEGRPDRVYRYWVSAVLGYAGLVLQKKV